MLNNKRQYIYSYDYKNRLVKVEKTVYKNIEGTETNEIQEIVKIIQYKYDNLDRRIQKIFNNGSIINYYYSNKDIILEENYTKVNNNGNRRLKTSKYYINGNSIDDVLVMEFIEHKTRKVTEEFVNNRGVTRTRNITENYTETNTYYYHKNHLSSIVAITDNLGNILEEYEYDLFGKPYSKDIVTGKVTNLKKSVIGNTRLFTGREYERGLQLYYNRARYYNPELGRFISRDPIDISDDVNLYSYVGNSPIGFVDPMGTEKAMIFVGIDSKLFGYSIGALYNAYNIQINKYLKEGYEVKNIELYFGENIDDFNYLVNNKYYKDISIVAHSNNNEIKINASSNSNENTINSETIEKLPDLSGRDTILTIVGCLSGNGDNSIAEQIAKQMKITVLAPDKILIADNIKDDYFISGGENLFVLPFVGIQGKKVEFKTFNP